MRPRAFRSWRGRIRARRTPYKDRVYASAMEAAYAGRLDLELRAEKIMAWEPQVVFVFPCGVKFIIDFKVTYADGHVEYHDVKGIAPKRPGKKRWSSATEAYKIKKRMLFHHYAIEVKEVNP